MNHLHPNNPPSEHDIPRLHASISSGSNEPIFGCVRYLDRLYVFQVGFSGDDLQNSCSSFDGGWFVSFFLDPECVFSNQTRSRGFVIGAGGGIRTHEGLRHGITHPRSQGHREPSMPLFDRVLSVAHACQARPAHLVSY